LIAVRRALDPGIVFSNHEKHEKHERTPCGGEAAIEPRRTRTGRQLWAVRAFGAFRGLNAASPSLSCFSCFSWLKKVEVGS
jgi:hypothetical protein